TGRDDIEVPAELRPQDTTADVLEAVTGGELRHFADVGEVVTRLRSGGQSPDSNGDAVSALVVEDGHRYLLVRRATGSGTDRVEVRNPGEGVLRANHFLPVGSQDLPSVRAMFFDAYGRPLPNEGTRPDAAPPERKPAEPRTVTELDDENDDSRQRRRENRRPGAGGPGFAGLGDMAPGIGGAVWFHHDPGNPPTPHEGSRHRTGYKTVSALPNPLVSASEVELVRPTVDSEGVFLGPDDEPYHTENEQGEPFLVLTTGEFVTANSWHDELLAAFDEDGGSLDEVIGFGTWKLSGRPTEIEAFFVEFGQWNADPMIPANILTALLRSKVDLSECAFDELGGERQGMLWRAGTAELPIDQLLRRRGRDAHRLFAGYGVVP
ncbi:hypothetical protein, partial [Nocardia sp. NPDC019302]|uniref:hypothetical protein n=1 Tax=Nocardia sp. NPDC019302 TaxID=3154592 RepID=UPI0033FAD010